MVAYAQDLSMIQMRFTEIKNLASLKKKMKSNTLIKRGNVYLPTFIVYSLGIPAMSILQKKYAKHLNVLAFNCGIYPELAASGIQYGLKHIIFLGDPKYYPALKDMARSNNIYLYLTLN